MLIAFYDLICSPISFDILSFLTAAQHEANGDKLHVVIVPGVKDGLCRVSDPKPIDDAEREWRLHHILVPSCALFGATVTIAPTRTFAGALEPFKTFPRGYRATDPVLWAYTLDKALKAIRAGAAPSLRASDRARAHAARIVNGRKVVTITLRETHTPSRNSNVDAWYQLAYFAQQKGWAPIMIRDTERMIEPQPMGAEWYGLIEHCPLAACDLDIRMALYEAAAMNMASSGGPFMLSVLGNLPYMFFLQVDPPADGSGDWVPTAEYMTKCGLPPGSQWPAAPERERGRSGSCGRIVWAADDFDTIKAAFDETIHPGLPRIDARTVWDETLGERSIV